MQQEKKLQTSTKLALAFLTLAGIEPISILPFTKSRPSTSRDSRADPCIFVLDGCAAFLTLKTAAADTESFHF
jgi:hypothetical protein